MRRTHLFSLVALATASGVVIAAGDPMASEATLPPDPLLPPTASPARDVETPPEPEPEPPAAGILQIRAAEVYLGDGNRIEDGVVVIENGRIRNVGRGVEIDSSQPVLEHDGVLTAGMVACHSWAGTRGENHDSTRSMLPEARIAYTFHPEHSDFANAVKAGITSIVLAPTGQNLAGGKTCVVKTAGGEVVKKEAHLALSFSGEALRQAVQQFFFFFNAETAVDDGLENTGGPQNGGRYPTSYSGSVAALDAAMADPQGAFAAAANGTLPVLLEAWDRHEVARAAAFAKKHGLRGAVRGAPLAGEVAGVLKDAGLGAIVGPFAVGHARRSLDGLADLSEAGVPFAFSLGASGTDPSQVRMSAAMAVGAGVDPVAAWKALSSDGARLAGVEDRVGRLERGMDADLVLWSGDPMNLATRVKAVFIGGELVHGGMQ